MLATATASWLQAEALYRLGDLEAATRLNVQATKLIRQIAPQSKLAGNIMLTSGSIHGDKTEVAAALVDLLNAHRLFVHVGEARSQAISLVCISTLFKNAKDYLAALRYLQEALEAFNADPNLAVSIHINRGAIFQENSEYSKAELEFTIASRLNVSAFTQQLLRNQARNYLLLGKLSYADKTIAIGRNQARNRDDVQLFLPLMAQSDLLHNRPNDAVILIEQFFDNVDLNTTSFSYRGPHQTAFNIYRALHRDDKALAHLIALKRLDDQATKLATETSTALMAARFDSANQEAKIARLQDAERLRVARDALQQSEMQRTLLLVVAIASMIILLLLLFAVRTLRRSRDQVRAANDDLNVTNRALNKALAAKTEFLASTSHEIRTPLNGILGMTQVMLADAALPESTRDRLHVVHGAGIVMRGLVDDILDVAKLEKGKLLLEERAFDLCACLTDASAMWAEQARAKRLRFETDLTACPPLVAGDAGRLKQIVSNLLSNAVKFTAAGTVTLRAEAAGDDIRISVADTGIGIAPDRQGDVFEPFRQADASTTRRYGGTGLGLSICRSLARAMGGDIVVESRLGYGSTFIVTLPLPVAMSLPDETVTADDGPVLLIAERNPIARAMFRSLFADHVDTVRFAATPAETAAAIAAGGVVHVLVDDATARAGGDPHGCLAAIVAAAGRIPVTLLWPIAAAAERDELLALGLKAVVAKPVSGRALIATLFPPICDEEHGSALVSRAA